MKKVVIINEGYAPYFTLHYFKRRKDMLAAYRRETGQSENADVQGFFAGIEVALQYNDGQQESRDWTIGDLWLCEETLQIEKLAHECLHMAQCYERSIYGFDLNYGRNPLHINNDEERAAYLLTDIMRATMLALEPEITFVVRIKERRSCK